MICRTGEHHLARNTEQRSLSEVDTDLQEALLRLRIANAASHFMAQDEIANAGTCRFDIVALNSGLIPTHIENAFEGAF